MVNIVLCGKKKDGFLLVNTSLKTVFAAMHLKYREGLFEKEYEALVTEGESDSRFFNGLL